MTTGEKAREIASKYERWDQEDDESYGAYNGAMEMAKWKEQQMVERVCDWLKENCNDYLDCYDWEKYRIDTNELIYDLKKAMEE